MKVKYIPGIREKERQNRKTRVAAYDSSKLKPQKSAKYGILNLPGFQESYPCVHKKDGFTEFEVSTQKIGSMNMLLGGGYIRMLPWLFMKWMTQKYLNTGKPYVMYIHPIDLSPMGYSIHHLYKVHNRGIAFCDALLKEDTK